MATIECGGNIADGGRRRYPEIEQIGPSPTGQDGTDFVLAAAPPYASGFHSDDVDEIREFIAHDAGFVHLGRFAARYRHAYGEPPSQTLRHRQRRA